MKWFVHLSVAVFLGLLFGFKLGLLVGIAQLLPLADFFLKYLFGYKPMHTILGFVIMILLYEANLPFVYVYLSLSHALHLLLDVNEGIALFQPWWKRTIKYAIPHSETIVLIGSIIGSIILILAKNI